MQKFPVKKGLSNAEELHEEINEYIDVLMGHIIRVNAYTVPPSPIKGISLNSFFLLMQNALARKITPKLIDFKG